MRVRTCGRQHPPPALHGPETQHQLQGLFDALRACAQRRGNAGLDSEGFRVGQVHWVQHAMRHVAFPNDRYIAFILCNMWPLPPPQFVALAFVPAVVLPKHLEHVRSSGSPNMPPSWTEASNIQVYMELTNEKKQVQTL